MIYIINLTCVLPTTPNYSITCSTGQISLPHKTVFIYISALSSLLLLLHFKTKMIRPEIWFGYHFLLSQQHSVVTTHTQKVPDRLSGFSCITQEFRFYILFPDIRWRPSQCLSETYSLRPLGFSLSPLSPLLPAPTSTKVISVYPEVPAQPLPFWSVGLGITCHALLKMKFE